jgi:outer membrane protein assembly factor BamB
MRVVPYPPGELGRPLDAVQLDVTDDGRLIHLDQSAAVPGGRVAAVESGEGWSTAVGDLHAAVPVRAQYSYASERQELVAIDSQGAKLWRRDDVLTIPAEGFHVALDGNVVLAAACSDVPDIDGDWCPGRKLLALDAATGRTLWERKGAWAVSVLGDGHVLIAGPFETEVATPAPDPARWTMIELSSGNSVGDHTWTVPWSFGIGCCDEPQGASRSGAVVFTVDDDTVEMWYPEARSTPLERVSLG